MNAHLQGRRSRQAQLLALIAVGSMATGCAMGDHRSKVAMDSAAGLYDQAKIEYKLDAGQLNLPLAVTRVEGQLVSYDQVPSDPRADSSVGTLKLDYPHPDGKPGFARARLEITSKSPTKSGAAAPETPSGWSGVAQRMNPAKLLASSPKEGVDEVWEFDVPRAQLDAVVTSLDRGGYFDHRQKGSEGVKVVARVDGKSMNKTWHQVPELNELMLTVRNQGQLVSYQRPAGQRSINERPSGLAAYERYSEQDRIAALHAGGMAAVGPQPGAMPTAQYVAQQGAPPVVPYFPAGHDVNHQAAPAMPAPGTVATGMGAPGALPPGAVLPGVVPASPLPHQDSIPWRAGSRPAPTMPAIQPPGTYPVTPPPGGAPNVAQQPRYPVTNY